MGVQEGFFPRFPPKPYLKTKSGSEVMHVEQQPKCEEKQEGNEKCRSSICFPGSGDAILMDSLNSFNVPAGEIVWFVYHPTR
mmetsp:Transcript_6269/g.9795  ORF Transcript_6269/g.9795 Transcript_6269/m.9795 type:complete len:82 (-) Transcript_6269:168-413(-)